MVWKHDFKSCSELISLWTASFYECSPIYHHNFLSLGHFTASTSQNCYLCYHFVLLNFPAAYHWGWITCNWQPAICEASGWCILSPWGTEWFPGSDADQLQIWHHLYDHKIRLHSSVRFGDWNLYLYEQNQWRHNICHCTIWAYLWYHWCEQKRAGESISYSFSPN